MPDAGQNIATSLGATSKESPSRDAKKYAMPITTAPRAADNHALAPTGSAKYRVIPSNAFAAFKGPPRCNLERNYLPVRSSRLSGIVCISSSFSTRSSLKGEIPLEPIAQSFGAHGSPPQS